MISDYALSEFAAWLSVIWVACMAAYMLAAWLIGRPKP